MTEYADSSLYVEATTKSTRIEGVWYHYPALRVGGKISYTTSYMSLSEDKAVAEAQKCLTSMIESIRASLVTWGFSADQ